MKKLLLNSALATLMLASLGACTEQTPQAEPIYSLGITTTIAEQSVARDGASSKISIDPVAKTTKFTSGDKMGLYLVEWNMANTAATTLEGIGNQTDNHLYSYDGTTWSAAALKNPLTYRKVSAYAYHPYTTTVANALSLSFTVNTDQSSGIKYTDYLMWGVGTANNTGYNPAKGDKIGLTFSHKLTRLIINVTLPTTYNSQTIKSIDAVSTVACPVGGTLKISDGTFTASTSIGEVKMYRSDNKTKPLEGVFEAMVVPCSITQYKEVVRIDYTTSTGTKDKMYYYAATGGLTLSANQIYTLTLKTSELSFESELPIFPASPITTNSIKVVCSTAKAWTVTSNNTDWLKVNLVNTGNFTNSITATNAGQTIYVQTAVNTTGQPRIGSLKLSSAGFSDREIVVRQN